MGPGHDDHKPQVGAWGRSFDQAIGGGWSSTKFSASVTFLATPARMEKTRCSLIRLQRIPPDGKTLVLETFLKMPARAEGFAPGSGSRSRWELRSMSRSGSVSASASGGRSRGRGQGRGRGRGRSRCRGRGRGLAEPGRAGLGEGQRRGRCRVERCRSRSQAGPGWPKQGQTNPGQVRAPP